MTSAPRSPRISHAYGAATLWPSSKTVRPASGRQGCVMAGFPANRSDDGAWLYEDHTCFGSGKSALSGACAFFHTMMERSYSITTAPFWLSPRVRTFTTPWPGLEFDSRTLITSDSE